MLSESAIIDKLKSNFPEYIGDDAAVLPRVNGHFVVTKDLLVENIHFRRRYYSPQALAHKALHVNLSDLAAMGATPQYIVLGLAIPKCYESAWVNRFLDAFTKACCMTNVVLIGGDTTAAAGDELFISITAMGIASKEIIKTRTHAKSGDVIALAGQFGHAHLGLMALESDVSGLDDYKKVFLTPRARIAEGAWLGAEPSVTAMMDTSDGVLIDLTRLCKASAVGACIYIELIQQTRAFKNACVKLGLDPTFVQWNGGEDYGLLITVDELAYPNLAQRFTNKFGYNLITIGQVTGDDGIVFLEYGQKKTVQFNPFSHF